MLRIEIIRESSAYVRSGMLMLFVGGLFHAVGLSAPYWIVVSGQGSGVHIGLWVSCLPGFGCLSNDSSLGVSWTLIASICTITNLIPTFVVLAIPLKYIFDTGWLNGCKFLELFSLLMLFGIIGLLVLYRVRNQKLFIILSFLGTIVSAVFIIMGVIIFVAESPFGGSLNWAFGLEIVAAIVLIPASVMLFLELRSGRSAYQST